MENQSSNNSAENKKSNQSISIPAAIISAAVIIAIALLIALSPKSNTNQVASPDQDNKKVITEVPADVATIRDNDRILGDTSKAEVAIIEYSDSDCPFCERFHPTLKTIYNDYRGKVALVYRYFPLDSLHPNASTEAIAMECVAQLGGNDAFNKYLDTIINITLSPNPTSNEALVTYASNQGIDTELFKKCMADPTVANRIKSDAEEAQRIGAEGTPFSVAVNLKTGKQAIIPGAYPLEYVKEAVDSILK